MQQDKKREFTRQPRPRAKAPRSAFAADEQLNDDAPDAGEGMLEGKNAVWEALSAERALDKIYFAAGSAGTLGRILAQARKLGVPLQECDRRKLDQMSVTGAHQGVIALCAAVHYAELSGLLAHAAQTDDAPLFVLCDGITDPHNLGAIIRSAEVAGAHGVVIPRRRSAGLNAACAKAAAGALEHLPVAKCANISSAIDELKKNGVFVFAADMEGARPMYDVDFTVPCAIVIGSEGFGVSRLAAEHSDLTVSIPQKGKITSLNASNAAAVLLYEALRQRMGK